jgi:excisionase family DNA binding protein
MIMSNRASFPEGILTYPEAANHLGCGKRTLQRWVSAGKIPESMIYKVGNRKGFKLTGLNKIKKGGGIT